MTFTCTKCGVDKPVSEYPRRVRIKRGHDSCCKLCRNVRRAEYFIENKEKETTRARVKAWKYQGITLTMDTYLSESVKRQNRCDICAKQVKSLHVDHCHTTGMIRGYLCGSCNRGLGLFQENVQHLKKAIEYLND